MTKITRLRRDGVSIGQVARLTGVKLETIRYYERIGIVIGPPRTATGHRVYASDDVREIAFVSHARQLGFSLAEIRRLLALRTAGPACCNEARDIALNHLANIRTRISDLSRLARLLEMTTGQSITRTTRCCPVMDLLDRPEGYYLVEDARYG